MGPENHEIGCMRKIMGGGFFQQRRMKKWGEGCEVGKGSKKMKFLPQLWKRDTTTGREKFLEVWKKKKGWTFGVKAHLKNLFRGPKLTGEKKPKIGGGGSQSLQKIDEKDQDKNKWLSS